MSFLDKVKNFVGAADEEYEDELEFTKNDKEEYIDPEPFNYDAPSPSSAAKKNNKVVNIHATTQLQVVLVKPERFDDASSVADTSTKSGRSCSTSNRRTRMSQEGWLTS